MKCKIDGCEIKAMYKVKQLCQKHYFRVMRNGHSDLLPKARKERSQNPAGYQKIFKPAHRLANSDGYVYEHRMLMYAKHGEHLPVCEMCGKEINWSSCHIDHIDENVKNNHIENLRPVCRGCNTSRTERRTIKKYSYQGKYMSVTEMAKIDGVQVGRHHLKIRLDSGMKVEDALFRPNTTHPKSKQREKTCQ